MPNKTTIRDFYGRILGYVTEDASGNKTARDFYGRIVATYDKKTDLTRDFYSRIIAHGDVTAGVIQNVSINQ